MDIDAGTRGPCDPLGDAVVPVTGVPGIDWEWAAFDRTLRDAGVPVRARTSEASLRQAQRSRQGVPMTGEHMARALVVAGLAPVDLCSATTVLRGAPDGPFAAAMSVVAVIDQVSFEYPLMGLRDLAGWLLAVGHPLQHAAGLSGDDLWRAQPWFTVEASVKAWGQAGFGFGAWVYAAAGFTPQEARASLDDGSLTVEQARAVVALRTAPMPA